MQPNIVSPPNNHPGVSLPDGQGMVPAAGVMSPSMTPPTPPAPPTLGPNAGDQPVPVVKVLSTRGVEYGMMTIALLVTATTLAWIILNMLNGSRGFDSVVVPTAALVVCLPVFGLLFLRLKKAELANPGLRLDPSKRRWSQTTQFLTYFALLINFIYFAYTILQHLSGGKGPSIGKSLANLLVILVIAGGVLLYYWRDEHRATGV